MAGIHRRNGGAAMYLGGLSYAGTLTRPDAQDSISHETDADIGGPVDDNPSYFRTISSISHASLASAYQAMRAHDLTLVPVDRPLPGEPNQELSVADGVITSGLGIPAAMDAYAEVMTFGVAEA